MSKIYMYIMKHSESYSKVTWNSLVMIFTKIVTTE